MNLACQVCYKSELEETSEQFQLFWKILQKVYEEIKDFSGVTVQKVENLITMEEIRWRNADGKPVQKESEEMVESLIWRYRPNVKERDLRVMIYLIIKEYIRNIEEGKAIEGEDYILNKIMGSRAIEIQGFLIIDEVVEERFEIKEAEIPERGKEVRKLINLLEYDRTQIWEGVRKNEIAMKIIEQFIDTRAFKLNDEEIKENRRKLLGITYREGEQLDEEEEYIVISVRESSPRKMNVREAERIENLGFDREAMAIPGFLNIYEEFINETDEILKEKLNRIIEKEEKTIFEDDDENIEESFEDKVDRIREMLREQEWDVGIGDAERLVNLGFDKYDVITEGFLEKCNEIWGETDEVVKDRLEQWLDKKEESTDKQTNRIFKEIRESLGIATLEEVRKLIEWGYTRSEIIENEIIIELRKLQMELNLYDDDEDEVRERLNDYVAEWKVKRMKKDIEEIEEYESEDEIFGDQNNKNVINTPEILESENFSWNINFEEEEINQEYELLRDLFRTPSPVNNMAA
ncbi:hypothetical protein RclHR1_24450001 [Rhizophagus clarus]|uniref:Uncharacterized protein n=1 Tax=Rhizophagus clarus TaxID=94130 RepID=A0A2Z6QZ88_9GLOM|nr:hypothetical protein RclHR1_24450001 [Rhizophagus clarus]